MEDRIVKIKNHRNARARNPPLKPRRAEDRRFAKEIDEVKITERIQSVAAKLHIPRHGPDL